ncbi:MAG: deoxyribodipyrimidine photo-lyase [Candidatus Omnitrophica bacterium]|nr:deoxyribodipyrimidine photo-lyase [Candidatus Omnitrophota bacterium]
MRRGTHPGRFRFLKEGTGGAGPVVYWMSRDQRSRDNWALLYAQEEALRRERPLVVIFCLVPSFLGATIRQYGFMLKALEELSGALEKKHIPFFLLRGEPAEEVIRFVEENGAALLVTDFDPLRIKIGWRNAISSRISIPFVEVDAHNIVPCWLASPKQEFGAYTIRPKIHRALDEFLDDFPPLKKHPVSYKRRPRTIFRPGLLSSLRINRYVPEVKWLVPGEKAAHQVLRVFLKTKLSSYSTRRNDPTQDGTSFLSPYLHFGHIAAQRVALEALKARRAPQAEKEAFLEELIVRRELSDNFCFYNRHYDTVKGFPDWAKKTLAPHRRDRRKYMYSLKTLEAAQTHDELWNAAQTQMVATGRMHGYMRMYWAKKILEWTPTPEAAMKSAIYLNDTYELDGRDPNGYTGIAWSIGGVHDRAWGERPVFGKIRYMSSNGCKAKFDIERYVNQQKG